MKTHPLFAKARIFAPGPTPVPEPVLAALAMAPLHHRTKAFGEMFARVRAGLSWLFETKQPVYTLTSSGTGAMEAAIVNCLAAGDEVLAVNGGKFGERFGKIAERYGLKVHWLKVPWGNSASPDDVTKLLKQHPATRAVLLQASETSLAVQHPTKAIAEAVHAAGDALLFVDAISALGVTELPMDRWGLDVVISGSQKALMLPPGLAFLALSPRAQEARGRANLPRWYFDLRSEDKALASGETAWTPAVSLVAALDVVLARLREVGLPAVFAWHERLAEGTRRGLKAMKLELLAKDIPATSVTAARVPSTIPDGGKILTHLRDEFRLTVAEGPDELKGKIFRVAHLGWFDVLDMLAALSAIEMTLKHLGHDNEPGRGVGAAQSYFSQT